MITTLLQKKLLIFTGKGGVGKSTLSATVAMLAAQAGKRVLMIESSNRAILPSCFETTDVRNPFAHHGDINSVPKRVMLGVDAVNATAKNAMDEFFDLYLPKQIAALIRSNKAVHSFLSVLPGVEETMILGKIIHAVKKSMKGTSCYDLVIFDAPSTGHAIQFLSAPRTFLSLSESGFLHTKIKEMYNYLVDPDITGINLVSLAEDMVMSETRDFFEILVGQLKMPPGAVFVNAVERKVDFTKQDIKLLKKKSSADNEPWIRQAEYYLRVKETHQRNLDSFHRDVDVPVWSLDQIDRFNNPFELLQRLGRSVVREERND